jgi:hypothetical protein
MPTTLKLSTFGCTVVLGVHEALLFGTYTIGNALIAAPVITAFFINCLRDIIDIIASYRLCILRVEGPTTIKASINDYLFNSNQIAWATSYLL